LVNVLAADKLMAAPELYATLLLWLLSEMFRTLPEIDDLYRPLPCFFFDEAHLLFGGGRTIAPSTSSWWNRAVVPATRRSLRSADRWRMRLASRCLAQDVARRRVG
jgi:hypothetical protein